MQHKMRMKTCGATIAIDEWVDPSESMMRTGRTDQKRFGARQFAIAFRPALHQPINVLPWRSDMAASLHILRPVFPWNDGLSFFSNPVAFG